MILYRSLLNLQKNIFFCKYIQHLSSAHQPTCCKALHFPRNCSRKLSTKTNWEPIYFFPMIKTAKFLNRFKLYQTLFTVAAIPTTSVLYHYNVLEFVEVKLFVGVGLLACLTLYPITWFFRRLIGFMYLSEDEKLVKVAHLTFWGKRNDIIIPVENIIPLSDCEYNPTDLYVKLKQYDSKNDLYFILKYGKILNRKKFEIVFGDLNLLQISKK